jgi:drug/metabolite transporter (DMT)-like permease
MNDDLRSVRRASVLAATAAAISSVANGAQLAATRLVVQHQDPLAFASIRYLIAFLCLAPLLHRKRWPPVRDCTIMLGLGAVVAGVCPWLLTISMRYTTAARGALVICISPLLTLMLASVLGHEKCTMRRTMGACCALLGVSVGLSGELRAGAAGYFVNPGDAVALSATVLLALFNVCAGRMLARHPAATIVPIASFGGLVVLFGFAAVDNTLGTIALLKPVDWAAALFCGTIGGAGVLLLWSWAIEHASAGRVAVFVTAAPISAAISGALLLSEPVTPQILAGTALIVAGIYLVYYQRLTGEIPPLASDSLASRPESGRRHSQVGRIIVRHPRWLLWQTRYVGSHRAEPSYRRAEDS